VAQELHGPLKSLRNGKIYVCDKEPGEGQKKLEIDDYVYYERGFEAICLGENKWIKMYLSSQSAYDDGDIDGVCHYGEMRRDDGIYCKSAPETICDGYAKKLPEHARSTIKGNPYYGDYPQKYMRYVDDRNGWCWYYECHTGYKFPSDADKSKCVLEQEGSAPEAETPAPNDKDGDLRCIDKNENEDCFAQRASEAKCKKLGSGGKLRCAAIKCYKDAYLVTGQGWCNGCPKDAVCAGGIEQPDCKEEGAVFKDGECVKPAAEPENAEKQNIGEETKKTEIESKRAADEKAAAERIAAERVAAEKAAKIAALKTQLSAQAKITADIRAARSGGKVSAWKNSDGKFNSARLASDSIAGVAVGAIGGGVTFAVMKKNQLKKGFEDLNCVQSGKKIADWGDEFSVSGAASKSECEAAGAGRGNGFVWASKNGAPTDYAGLIEDARDPGNNACWMRVEVTSEDSRIKTDSMGARYFMSGTRGTCGGWLDEKAIEKQILAVKKKARVGGVIAGALGGAALGVGAMELFGNKAIGGKVMGQKGLSGDQLLKSQILSEGGGETEWNKYETARNEAARLCGELRALGGSAQECE
jgi:hypothetical protein